jgi:predicted nucleic-acid-binding protein
MRAIDTNILARFYTQDDPAQAKEAESILAAGNVFVPKTVLLELEWVLRAAYGFAAPAIARTFDHLSALPGVMIEDPEQIEHAIGLYKTGFDFADAMHYAAAHACEAFLTFDNKGFVRKAAKRDLRPKVVLAGKKASV